MRPKVSAIIANRNGADHLRICLPSLRAQSHEPLEIVVVDNGSSDDSEVVARQFGATWLPLGRNLGLAPALNRGAAVSNAEFLLFVNNDMRFDRDFVSRLAGGLDLEEWVFAADGMQFNWDGTAEGHLATRVAKRSCGRMATEIVPGLFLCQERSESARRVFMASAASMLVRRSVFELLHGFDERLPLSYEDLEICWRARLHGWRTVFVPNAVCWHRVGASCRTEEENLLLFRGVLRGRLLIATKYLPTRYALATWVASVAGLVRDAICARWRKTAVRSREIVESALLARQWRRERHEMYCAARTTPAQQFDSLIHIGEDGGRVETSPPGMVSEGKWSGASGQ